MKKYTYSNSKWVLLGMILPILAFFFSLNVVYAYFTASATSGNVNVPTGAIKIGFVEEELGVKLAETETVVENILPGYTIDVCGTIKNVGTVSLYAVVEVELKLDGSLVHSEYLTPSGTKLVYDSINKKYTTEAQTMAKDEEQIFTFTYKFDFYKYDNTYNGKEVKVNIAVHAIQTYNVTAVDATNMLLNTPTA